MAGPVKKVGLKKTPVKKPRSIQGPALIVWMYEDGQYEVYKHTTAPDPSWGLSPAKKSPIEESKSGWWIVTDIDKHNSQLSWNTAEFWKASPI